MVKNGMEDVMAGAMSLSVAMNGVYRSNWSII